MMNWRRRSYDFDGLASLGLFAVAWAVALIGLGFCFKLIWKLFMFGWGML